MRFARQETTLGVKLCLFVFHYPILIFLAALLSLSNADESLAKELPPSTSQWHSFARHDFMVDGRNCIVVAPKSATEGNPWIWRARFFGHEPQADIELLKRGYHVAYCDVAGLLGAPSAVKHWDAFYKHVTEQYGFAKTVALEGMSRGGLIIFNWAAANPEKVSCILRRRAGL